MTNEQKARFLDYCLTLADHVIGGKPAFLPEECFRDAHTFDGVTCDEMHDLIGWWGDAIDLNDCGDGVLLDFEEIPRFGGTPEPTAGGLR